MALKATVFKAEVSIADMDRYYYASHHLTIARHPSETDQRMMLRLLAFAMNASDELKFTKGLSTDTEPELWLKSLNDDIQLWIELGLPDESRIRKACHRARQVAVYAYGGHSADLWWAGIKPKLSRFSNLTVINFPKEVTDAMAEMAQRTMRLNCNIEDAQVTISNEEKSVLIEPQILLAAR